MKLLIVGIAALFALLIYSAIQEEKAWQEFSSEQSCVVIEKIEGHTSTGVGVGFVGGNAGTIVTTTSTPDKTAYLCNDGVTYWR